MSTDDLNIAQQRKKGLRVALAVSVGFTIALWMGAIIPFLGPLFAAQFLLASSRPMALAKTIGMVFVILIVGVVMMGITALLADRPATLVAVLGLTYFICFAAQSTGKGGPAIFLVLIVTIIVPLFGILNKELANSILSILVTGVLSGTLLMWVAYAVVPEPPARSHEIPALSSQPVDLWRALANSVILLASVVICLTSDNLTAAAVIPITIASLLGQIDVAASMRTAAGLLMVNLFGGLLASLAYAVLTIRPSLLATFLIVLIVGLWLGGRAAVQSKDAPMFAGSLTIFLILFGLGVSPLPGSAAESFVTRILYVAAALIYTLLLTAIMWPSKPETRNNKQSLG